MLLLQGETNQVSAADEREIMAAIIGQYNYQNRIYYLQDSAANANAKKVKPDTTIHKK